MFCSGQLGITPDDAIPESAADQTRLCFETIRAILASAGMTLADIVRIKRLRLRPRLPQGLHGRARRIHRRPRRRPSTLMVVSGFARPEFKVEVEVVAAKED